MCTSPDWDKLYVNFLPKHIPNEKAHKMNPFVTRPNLCMCVYVFGERKFEFQMNGTIMGSPDDRGRQKRLF